jgi:putative ABC transport system substrate-binding protein
MNVHVFSEGRIMRLSTLGLLVTLACGIGLCWTPRVATAQQPGKVYRIGFLSAMSPPAPSKTDGQRQSLLLQPFLQEMRQLGWREGQNIVMEERWADMRFERLPALATELVQLPVDLIVAAATLETVAAKEATSTIPIVMVNSLDAVKTGLVASLAHPGANVTGRTAVGWDREPMRLKLLKEAVPGISRIAVLWCTAVPGSDAPGQPGGLAWKDMQFAANTLGVQLQRLEVREPDDYERAYAAAINEHAEALFVRQCYLHKLNWRNLQRVVDFTAQHRLPAIYDSREFVQAVGLMAYEPSWPEGLRQAATYVDQILKGAKPADLLVQQPTKFQLVINLKAAQALGLTIPPALLKRADEVIR